FFQAEDGIRDFHVTGVQTCALPIWGADRSATAAATLVRSRPCAARIAAASPAGSRPRTNPETPSWTRPPVSLPSVTTAGSPVAKIGRASCRERVEGSLGGGARERTG